MAANRDASGVLTLASRRYVDGAVIVEAHALLWRVCRALGGMGYTPDRRESGSRLQIGGGSYAPSATDFFAVSMQEIGEFIAKSEIADLGRKGWNFGGQD